MKNLLITAAVTLVLGGGLIYAVKSASASEPHQDMVSFLAQKLGIGEDKVKDALTAFRGERQSQMQTRFEDKLTQLVKGGKITEVQKQAILTKMAELKTKREEYKGTWKNMSPEDRKNAMQKERDDLNAWAKANGIDLKYLFGFGRGFGFKMRHGWMW